MVNTKGTLSVRLTPGQVESYMENGLLIVKDPAIADLQDSLRAKLKKMSLKIMERYDGTEIIRAELEDSPYSTLVDWCVNNETDREITRAFYEMYPTMSEIVALVDNPVFLDIARQIGVETPIPSTLPVVRIDRPNDVIYSTPTHQDYWFSMVSHNSTVFWMPINPMSPDMGYLQGIPGSHKNGPIPFKEWDYNENLVSIQDFPDAEFDELPLGNDELLVFHQCLIHRSGKNVGERARVSLQLRYNDFETLEALNAVYKVQISPYVKERQKELRQD